MWKTEYSDAFLALENQYSDIIVGGLAGHTHMDDFRVVSNTSGKAISFFHINPSISPIFSNNPGFQLFTYDAASMTMLDYNTYAFQGLQNTSDQTWKMEYDFGKTYNVNQLTGQTLGTVWQAISTDSVVRGNYLNYFGMGSVQAKPTIWMPYWCGIGDLGQTQFGDCACGGK
jgi:sphingomyelin phosphodiesterase acid-like 3